MPQVLLTGANGFVGQHVTSRLLAAGCALTLAARRELTDDAAIPTVRRVRIGAIDGRTDWMAALEGCDTVVHMAAQTPGRGVAPENFRCVNDEGTARLAEQAAAAGVHRFVLVSSIFALVDNSAETVVDDATPSATVTPYGRSKLAAESHARGFAGAGRESVSLRPPLVYGAGAKGNWALLQRLAASPLPLPLGSVANRRTLISVANLADAIRATVERPLRPRAAGEYAVCDSDSVSLADMLSLIREGIGRRPGLIKIPAGAISAALRLLGRGQMARSLLGNLEVDSSRFRDVFSWAPPERAPDAIRKSGAEFAAASR